MVLICELYPERVAARAAEFAECLRRNCENRWIEEVHVFVEDGGAVPVRHPKLRCVQRGRRLTFRDAFSYANERLAGRRVIVANSDIHFDRSLARLDGCSLRDRMMCLSRWDLKPDVTSVYFDFSHSQDAWMFEAPVRARFVRSAGRGRDRSRERPPARIPACAANAPGSCRG